MVSGLHVPLVTPFDEDGGVDLAALEQLAGEVLADGADGLVALATTGEATSLDERERDAIVAICARVAADRGAALMVGAGTNDTRTTIARHEALAEVEGVTASLAVVPSYVRPSEAAIVAHFQTVAARSPVPLVLYNIPYRTGSALGAAALLELAGTDGIVGLKQAVNGLDADTLRLLSSAPSDFAVLCGDDPFIAPLMLMGARGAIAASAQLCTERFAALVAAAGAGRVDEARKQAEVLLPLVLALFAEPSPAVLKAMLHDAGRIATPVLRMPLQAASPAGLERARRSAPSRSSARAPARAR